MRVLIAMLLLFPALALATDITVTGSGSTTDEATQNALRQAVEYAAGVYVHSTTTVEDSALVTDKIITASKSLVSTYSVLSQNKVDDMVVVKLVATVSPQAVSSVIKAKGGVSMDDSIKAFHLITNRVMQLRRAAELLNAIKSMPVSDMYVANYLGYEVVSVSLDGATVRLKYSIARNPFFWDAYYQIMNHLKEEGGWFSAPKDTLELCLGHKCGDSVYINDGLREYTVDLNQVKAELTLGSFSVSSEVYRLYDNNHVIKECPQGSGRYCDQLLSAYSSTYSHYPWPLWRYMTSNYPAEIDKIPSDGFEDSVVATIKDLELIKVLPKMKVRVVAGN